MLPGRVLHPGVLRARLLRSTLADPRCAAARGHPELLRHRRLPLNCPAGAHVHPDPLAADEFVAAFARHGRALWVLAAAWVGRAEAQDLVQETARIAWQRRAHFARGSNLAAWLAQIVRHTGANWRRRRRPEPHDPAALPEPLARREVQGHGLHGVDPEQLPAGLAQALQALPEVARACLLLHAVAGLTFPEIATMLDVPVNTAMSHARRARLALRAAVAAAASPAEVALPETP